MICSANPWTSFYMIGNSVMKELTTNVPMTKKRVNLFTNQLSGLYMKEALVFMIEKWPTVI